MVVADYADNPGAGAYGDSARRCWPRCCRPACRTPASGSIHDPQAVQQLMHHAVGDTVQLPLGGKTDPRFGGGRWP
jgi:microcystin degradation protein MlrC